LDTKNKVGIDSLEQIKLIVCCLVVFVNIAGMLNIPKTHSILEFGQVYNKILENSFTP
jgi:hypothetical protein